MGTLQVQETNLLRYDVQVGDNKSFIFGPRVVAALRFCQLYFSILCVRDRFSALAGCELLKGAEPFVLPACHTTLRSWVCMRGLQQKRSDSRCCLFGGRGTDDPNTQRLAPTLKTEVQS